MSFIKLDYVLRHCQSVPNIICDGKYYENKLKRIGTCARKILFLNKHQISMILMVISCMKTLKTKNAADVV